MGIRCRVTDTGFFHDRRVFEGDEITLVDIPFKNAKGQDDVLTAESQFSAKWMERIDEDEEVQPIRKRRSKLSLSDENQSEE
jgi:hypothetical protein